MSESCPDGGTSQADCRRYGHDSSSERSANYHPGRSAAAALPGFPNGLGQRSGHLNLSRFTVHGMLCLPLEEASVMAHVQFTDVQDRPTEFLDLTSLTLDEFQQLVPPFEAAFQAHMAAWCLDGKPRTARRFSVYQNCPLPTPEDRLLFILAY